MRAKLLLSLAALLVSAMLVAALGEVVLRVMALRSDPVPLGEPLPGSPRRYGLRPGTRSVQLGVDVAINALGFRERDYPLAKPAGVQRIAVLGDSYAFGAGVALPDTFCKRLERQLNDSGRPSEVINFGVIGYNTTLELATFNEVVAAFRPDLVIVAYVLNDAEPRPDDRGTPAAAGDAGSRLSAAHLYIKDRSLLYRYLAPAAAALLERVDARYAVGKTREIMRDYRADAPGWIESQRALVEIAAGARRIGADTLLVVFPMMVGFSTYPLAPAHDTIVQFARRHGIETLDLLPRFTGRDASELTIFLDGHPNAAAHAIFADAIFDHLLGPRAARPLSGTLQ